MADKIQSDSNPTPAAEVVPISSRLPFTSAFRSKYADFDWNILPRGTAIMVRLADESRKQITYTCISRGQSFLLTEEGFWYHNKRFPRRHPSLAKDWPRFEPFFEPEYPPHLVHYFNAIDLNIIRNQFKLFGQVVTPKRQAHFSYALDHNGFITRVPKFSEHLERQIQDETPYRFVQSFWTKNGVERIVETGLADDGRTFVLANETIEQEMDDLPEWYENGSMLLLQTYLNGPAIKDDEKQPTANGILIGRDNEMQTRRPRMEEIIEESVETVVDPMVPGKLEDREVIVDVDKADGEQ